MKPKAITVRAAGYTLVEICVSLAVLALVGGIAYSMLMSSTTLLAKNLSLNSSNIIVRTALDRIYAEVNQANRLPTLINADGTAADSSVPAAGILSRSIPWRTLHRRQSRSRLGGDSYLFQFVLLHRPTG